MGKSSGGIVFVLALTLFAAGALVALQSLQVGVAIILSALSVACIARYRLESPGFAGSLALIPGALVVTYVYGSVDRENPVYYTNVSPIVWGIIVLGSVSLVFGLFVASGPWHKIASAKPINFSAESWFFWLGSMALAVAIVNYATGDIPLLSGDINGARLGGDYGLLGRLWPIVHPITQISVVVAAVTAFQNRLDIRWSVLGFLSASSLLLSGGRSLLMLSLLAVAILYLEIRRPKLQSVFIALFIALAVFGAFGQIRALSSAGGGDFQSYMERRDLDSWLGSTELSLQTGPRVLTLAVELAKENNLQGRFAIADFANFLDSSVTRSDQMITIMIGREPAVVGGSPPTIFGGLYLDFGWLGVAFGSALVGIILVVSRRLFYSNFSLQRAVWLSYISAYIAISAYSYVSVRPSWIVVLAACTAAGFLRREANGKDTSGFEVQRISRRSGTPHLRSD